MAKGTYQTYTAETPISDYRTDFMHRGAMCAALAKRHPGLAAIGKESDDLVVQIDSRRTDLQKAEDNQIRARALEEAEKIDVIEAYTEIRRTLFAKGADIQTLLPDSPSSLGRMGIKSLGERADQAVNNLRRLPDTDPVKKALLPTLVQEVAELHAADLAEDKTRAAVASERVALTLYKAELSAAREAQLGGIQKVLGDSEKMALFTLPWRSSSRSKPTDTDPTPPPPPTP